jgi:hypothetical protein
MGGAFLLAGSKGVEPARNITIEPSCVVDWVEACGKTQHPAPLDSSILTIRQSAREGFVRRNMHE